MTITPEEQAAIEFAKAHIPPAGWLWDDRSKTYVAPVNPPEDGRPYIWDEALLVWSPVPDCDGPTTATKIKTPNRWEFIKIKEKTASLQDGDSVYVPSLSVLGLGLSSFWDAGFAINIDETTPSRYVYCPVDHEYAQQKAQAYAARFSLPALDFSLNNKILQLPKFSAAGFTLLKTTAFRHREDLTSFPHQKVILKPAAGMNTEAAGPFARFMYRVETRDALDRMLQEAHAFDDPGTLLEMNAVIQQAADSYDGADNYKALILTGAINGSGDFWHFAPILLDQRFVDGSRYAKSVHSEELLTDGIGRQRELLERLLAESGAKNCFYQMQFLKLGDDWAPHDFQYRMSYYVTDGLEELGFSQHKVSIVKFVYDRAQEKQALPSPLGICIAHTRGGEVSKKFVRGSTVEEVRSQLENL
jgi:hypothetical protein